MQQQNSGEASNELSGDGFDFKTEFSLYSFFFFFCIYVSKLILSNYFQAFL